MITLSPEIATRATQATVGCNFFHQIKCCMQPNCGKLGISAAVELNFCFSHSADGWKLRTIVVVSYVAGGLLPIMILKQLEIYFFEIRLWTASLAAIGDCKRKSSRLLLLSWINMKIQQSLFNILETEFVHRASSAGYGVKRLPVGPF